MPNIPLHPAVVHLPLGLAMFLPLLAIIFAIGIWRGWFSARSWFIVAVFHFLLFGSAFVAVRTGENEEEKVEKAIAESAIESHEGKAEVFLWASGLTLVLTGGASLIRKKNLGAAARMASTLGLLTVAGLALSTGHSGGALIYQHGAAQAYLSAFDNKAGPPAGETGLMHERSPERDDPEDD